MEDKKRISAYQKLVEGIEGIIDSGKYTEFLKSMKKFHHYSFNNRLLIFAQNPDATKVAGYCTWKELGRGVKSNPKKIFILRPMPYKMKKEEKDKQLEENDEETVTLVKYGWTIVYDISDTYIREDAKEVPLFDDIKINANTSQDLYSILLKISPVKVEIVSTGNGADGYYSKSEKKIVLSPLQSEDDKTATLLHEISHALYDDFDYSKERNLSEIFVESVAYITADYFGLNTSKCSFSYITKWSKGDTKELLKLGTKIQDASDKLINRIEEQIKIADNQAA
ncbi:MAG: hypothetical protein HFJ29_00955 [Clostridia bacterium]|nr:hypothetical protein [Clostridia bacterium]